MSSHAEKGADVNLAWFYVGAFLGPLGGQVLGPLVPTLMQEFQVELAVLSLAMPIYMIPFAFFQLISGALSDAFSRRAVVVLGFVGYALSAVLGALAPNISLFLVARALQGVTNAFTTPILMATLAETVPSRRLGRTMGIFAAVNTGGIFVAPLVAGRAAESNWRLAYMAIALPSAVVALYYWRWYTARAQAFRPGTREWPWTAVSSLLGPQLLVTGIIAAFGYLSLMGTAYLWALYLRQTWDVASGQAGLIQSSFGLAGLLAAPLAGAAADRLGRGPVAALGAVVGGAAFVALMIAPSPVVFALLLFVAGAAFGLFWAGVNTLILESFTQRRGTAASLFNCFKFLGNAAAPVVYNPLFVGLTPGVTFAAAGAMAGVMALPIMYYQQRWGRTATRGVLLRRGA